MIFIMSNEYTKKISNHLLITVSRSTCNSLFALSIYLSFSLPCPFAVALYVSRFFYRFPFSLFLFLYHILPLSDLSLLLSLLFPHSHSLRLFFAFFTDNKHLRDDICKHTHTKIPDYYQTRPLFSLIYDQRLNSFPSLLYIHTGNKVDHYFFCCCCCSLLQLNKMLFSK